MQVILVLCLDEVEGYKGRHTFSTIVYAITNVYNSLL
jgi:hypothetical protein